MNKTIAEIMRAKAELAREVALAGVEIIDTTVDDAEVEIVAYDTVPENLKGFYITEGWEDRVGLFEAIEDLKRTRGQAPVR